MPKFGFTQETAEIVRWLKQPGDEVEQGDPILEVTTDKVNMEVEAPVSGILDGVRYAAGEVVPVIQVIAFIRKPNEALPTSDSATTPSVPAATPPPPAPPVAEAETRPSRVTPVAAKVARDAGVDVAQVVGTGVGGRVTRGDVTQFITTKQEANGTVRSVPAARRLARETGVDLAGVVGSGPHGRVQSADVLEALKQAQQAAAAPAAPEPRPALQPTAGGLRVARAIPMTGMRRTIATRLQKAAQEIPHITFDADIDVTAAEALRARANARLKPGQAKVSLTALIARTCAWALKRHELLNSRLDGDSILVLDDVNIGVAVALDEGLIVPVVRDVARKGLGEIAADMADLTERARAGRLRPEDVQDGTFTISNLGMFGVDRFTAIINPPQVAILAVSRATRRIVPDVDGNPVTRPIMTVTLAADHRVVDGAVAARFLSDVRDALEQPELLVL